MPVVLLVVMGYAINLDVDHLRLGIWRTDSGARRCGWSRPFAAPRRWKSTAARAKAALLASLERGGDPRPAGDR